MYLNGVPISMMKIITPIAQQKIHIIFLQVMKEYFAVVHGILAQGIAL